MAAKPTSPVTTAAVNEALLLGSLRQHELIEAAANLNAQMEAEIAARQNTTRELAEKARLLDLTQDAIIVRGLDGRVSYWNHGAEILYGGSSEEAFGSRLSPVTRRPVCHFRLWVEHPISGPGEFGLVSAWPMADVPVDWPFTREITINNPRTEIQTK